MPSSWDTVQFSSITQSCPTLCDPMNCSTPGLPVHHKLPEFTQTHGHQVGDAIQPSHPLLSPSPPAPNPSQHQGIFQWVNSSHDVAKVLEFQLQHQSFQWTPRTYLLQDGLVGSPCSPRDSQEASPTPQFKSVNFSALSFLHSPTLISIYELGGSEFQNKCAHIPVHPGHLLVYKTSGLLAHIKKGRKARKLPWRVISWKKWNRLEVIFFNYG